jgi:hypothetical protein
MMTDCEEVEATTAEAFTYRALENHSGRYRLTAGQVHSRQPVRILRSHTLSSPWAPRAGVRYDGLCVVVMTSRHGSY